MKSGKAVSGKMAGSSAMRAGSLKGQSVGGIIVNQRVASPEQQRKANKLLSRLAESADVNGWKPLKREA